MSPSPPPIQDQDPNDDYISDSSTDEDDDAILLDKQVSKEILSTISAIRSNDPSIKDSTKNFFSELDDKKLLSTLEAKHSLRSSKPSVLLPQYEASLNLAELPDEDTMLSAPQFDDESERAALKELAESSEDSDNELFERIVPITAESVNQLPEDIDTTVFDEGNEEEQFLKEYILNEQWKGGDPEGAEEILKEIERDQEHIDRENQFEEDFNFRFENSEVISHSRIIEGSVRQKLSKRQRQRESKKERQKSMQSQLENETKNRKATARNSILDKLVFLENSMGMTFTEEDRAQAENISLVDEDYDETKFDEFIENNFDKFQDESYLNDLETEVRFRLGRLREAFESGSLSKTIEEETLIEQEVEIERLLDQYYALDYEDVVGDVKCRFKYKNVEPDDFGLDVLDILTSTSEELNRKVGLKSIAPYADGSKESSKASKGRKRRQSDDGDKGFSRLSAYGGLKKKGSKKSRR
ncbi:hypothetical protein GEMRC1_001816 [Eukaryota sp. GEM-RC1]